MAPGVDPLEQAKRAKEHARHGFLDAVETGQQMRREVETAVAHGRRNHFGEDLSWLWRRGSATP